MIKTNGIYEIIGVSEKKTKDKHKLYKCRCKICGFEKEAVLSSIKNTKKCTHIKKQKYCLNCGKELTGCQKVFCSISCSTTFNNKQKGLKTKRYCTQCGKELTSKQKLLCCECEKKEENKERIEKFENGENIEPVKGRSVPKWLRTYLLQKNNYSCELCGWDKRNPYSGLPALEIHHKNGDRNKNSKDNLQVLCPNCHSLTPNYKNTKPTILDN